MLLAICPSMRLSNTEWHSLTDWVNASVQARTAAESWAATAQQNHIKSTRENVRLRYILMDIATRIPDEVQESEDEVFPVDVPTTVAKTLNQAVVEKTIAQTVYELGQGKAKVIKPGKDEYVYPNPVNVDGVTEKALHCQDLVTGEDFWVPRGQVSKSSEVSTAFSEGTLVVTFWWAKEKGWVPKQQVGDGLKFPKAQQF